jgi:uncharacterized protein (TIGR00369 family)
MMSTLGVEVTAAERGKVWMSLGHDERFTQQHGFMHAGAVASVLDSACGYAAFSVMPPDAAVLTVSYTINLMAPAAGDRPFAAMQATMTAVYGKAGISG